MDFKISINYNEQAIPFFDENNIYHREEKNGYSSVVLPKVRYPQYILLNITTKYILSLMNGENTVYDIYKILISKYGKKYESQIKIDLSNILEELWTNGIISWKGSVYPNMDNLKINLENGYKVTVAFDHDLTNICEFLKSDSRNNFIFKNPIAAQQYDSQLHIRYSLFNMSSVFFLLKDNNNEIKGIAIVYIPQSTSVASIDFINCEENKIGDLFFGIKKLLKSAAVFEMTKIRTYISPNHKNISKVDNMLNEFNFYKVALLKNENKTEDLLMYDYILE